MEEDFPVFNRLYNALKSVDGVIFDNERDVETFEPIKAVKTGDVIKRLTNYGGIFYINLDGPFDKLEYELKEVQRHCGKFEKVLRKYFDDELDDEDEDLLLDEEDYLLQCKPRIQELIEAGSVGLFPDDVYDHCFKAFDEVNRVLDIKKNGFPNEKKKAAKKVAKKPAKKPAKKIASASDDSVDDEDIDLFFDSRAKKSPKKNSPKKASPKKGKKSSVDGDDAMAILDDILKS